MSLKESSQPWNCGMDEADAAKIDQEMPQAEEAV